MRLLTLLILCTSCIPIPHPADSVNNGNTLKLSSPIAKGEKVVVVNGRRKTYGTNANLTLNNSMDVADCYTDAFKELRPDVVIIDADDFFDEYLSYWDVNNYVAALMAREEVKGARLLFFVNLSTSITYNVKSDGRLSIEEGDRYTNIDAEVFENGKSAGKITTYTRGSTGVYLAPQFPIIGIMTGAMTETAACNEVVPALKRALQG